ncbi:MAG: Coenzyme F420 hydrogenase/dehydrogenase, beta subunit C-terminal domain [Planctomycetaceae bacterium]|nr:Coenzyme F420 hydrogenase/dehydrogenase, beta subunit C-terminal domain [Planctomycetaceae bacterium]
MSHTIIEEVVQHEKCSCCGMCAAVCPQKRLTVRETDFGEFFPHADKEKPCPDSCRLCLSLCPSAHRASPATLRTHQTFVGAVSQESERLKAPSGGFATALLCRLLEEQKINAAIVLTPTTERPWFKRRIATTADEILQSRGSVYHVIKNDDVLREILDGPERQYAIVALPCLAKAIRLAQAVLPKLQKRIRYVFSLTCGGCNTLHVPDLLTVMLGDRQAEMRYRSKQNAKNALDFSITLPNAPKSSSIKMLGPFGFLWGNHIGRLIACRYCTDVFAECADAVFMDAWLPEYIPDIRGTSLAISRSAELSEMFAAMFQDGTLQGGTISPDKVHESQASLVEERQLHCQIFTALESQKSRGWGISPSPEHRWGKRSIAFHSDMRNLFRYYSHRLARNPNWYSRFYVIRLFWLIFLSLVRHRLLKKTLQSLRFLRKKG